MRRVRPLLREHIPARVVSGTRTIRISIDTLANQATIAANGNRNISSRGCRIAGETINPIYLITSNETSVNLVLTEQQENADCPEGHLGATENTARLSHWAAGAEGIDPADPGLHKAGRALLITHNTVTRIDSEPWRIKLDSASCNGRGHRFTVP
jgi:hypothetical protein